MGNAFLSMKKVNEKNFIILAVLLSFVLSTFLNALIVMVLFMPIIDVIAAQLKGEFTRKNTYLPIGIAAVFGGNLSVVGSTSMLNASAMLEESYYGKAMNFFEPAKLGLPGVIVCLLIFLIFGTKLQKKFFDFDDLTPNEPVAAMASGTKSINVPAWKRWFVLSVMFLCIVGFVVGLNYGAVALLGGCAVIAAGCINMKQAIRGISWEAVLVVAGTLGFAKGVEYSGAGQKITDAMLSAFGPPRKISRCNVHCNAAYYNHSFKLYVKQCHCGYLCADFSFACADIWSEPDSVCSLLRNRCKPFRCNADLYRNNYYDNSGGISL